MSCSGTIQPSEKLKRLYSEDINFDNLKLQLQMLPNLVHTVNEQCHLGIKKVTLISTICEVFNSDHHTKVMLSKVHQLLRLLLLKEPFQLSDVLRTTFIQQCVRNDLTN